MEGWKAGIEDLGSRKGMLEGWIWRKEGRVYREGEEDRDVEKGQTSSHSFTPPPPRKWFTEGFLAPTLKPVLVGTPAAPNHRD